MFVTSHCDKQSHIEHLNKVKIEFQVCGWDCCVSGSLDSDSNDFEEGQTSSFQGNELGECEDFDIGTKTDWSGAMTLYHSGLDGGKFEHALVYTDEGIILKCYFSKFLESDDFEEGFGCFEY